MAGCSARTAPWFVGNNGFTSPDDTALFPRLPDFGPGLGFASWGLSITGWAICACDVSAGFITGDIPGPLIIAFDDLNALIAALALSIIFLSFGLDSSSNVSFVLSNLIAYIVSVPTFVENNLNFWGTPLSVMDIVPSSPSMIPLLILLMNPSLASKIPSVMTSPSRENASPVVVL